MDGEQNGSQESTQNQEEQAQAQQAASQQVGGGSNGNNAPAPDYEKAIAEHDERITSLEAQIAEAAKSAEQAEKLSAEVAELKQASADERVDFSLQLAGCRNVKAARAGLDDYDGETNFGYAKKATTGRNINYMVVEKSAVIKFDKHVASRVFHPDELEGLDSYMMKCRKYGIVAPLDGRDMGLGADRRRDRHGQGPRVPPQGPRGATRAHPAGANRAVALPRPRPPSRRTACRNPRLPRGTSGRWPLCCAGPLPRSQAARKRPRRGSPTAASTPPVACA